MPISPAEGLILDEVQSARWMLESAKAIALEGLAKSPGALQALITAFPYSPYAALVREAENALATAELRAKAIQEATT